MLSSRTERYSASVDQDARDGDVAVWIRPIGPDSEDFSLDEIEALVHRGVIRELLAEERREA